MPIRCWSRWRERLQVNRTGCDGPLPEQRALTNEPLSMTKPITQLRHLGYIEGISFLVLLGVAMPLKYLAGFRMAVTVFGWVHGVLFVLFCVALLRAMIAARWSLFRGAVVFVAALVPFGPFLIDRRLKEWESEVLKGG